VVTKRGGWPLCILPILGTTQGGGVPSFPEAAWVVEPNAELQWLARFKVFRPHYSVSKKEICCKFWSTYGESKSSQTRITCCMDYCHHKTIICETANIILSFPLRLLLG